MPFYHLSVCAIDCTAGKCPDSWATKDGLAINRRSVCRRSATSRGRKSKPVTPSWIHSGMPPKAAVTTGFFAKNASRITSGAFSYQKVRETPSRLRKTSRIAAQTAPSSPRPLKRYRGWAGLRNSFNKTSPGCDALFFGFLHFMIFTSFRAFLAIFWAILALLCAAALPSHIALLPFFRLD